MSTARATLALIVAVTIAIAGTCGCSSTPEHPADAADAWITPFPEVRVNSKDRLVEFDGVVPIDPHDRETPTIYLEVVVCSHDTREHESLVVTKARPSHVHAALLLLGLEPGSPGTWRPDDAARKMVPVPPTGPGVEVTFLLTGPDGRRSESSPADWIIDVRDRRSMRDRGGTAAPVWMFAGSAIAPRPDGPGEYYKADIEGTLVGLATFGTETLGWRHVFSPEAAIHAPEWIADPARVPAFRTPVTVRLRAIEPGSP